MCTPIEAGDTGVIRAAGVAFVEPVPSPDELGIVLHKRLGKVVCENVFVFRPIDQRGWHKLSVHQSIECGDARGVTIKWRTCLRTDAQYNGQKCENQGGLAHNDCRLIKQGPTFLPNPVFLFPW